VADGKLATVHYLPRVVRVPPGLVERLEALAVAFAAELGEPLKVGRRGIEQAVLLRGIASLERELLCQHD